jgi:hypothetical protein
MGRYRTTTAKSDAKALRAMQDELGLSQSKLLEEIWEWLRRNRPGTVVNRHDLRRARAGGRLLIDKLDAIELTLKSLCKPPAKFQRIRTHVSSGGEEFLKEAERLGEGFPRLSVRAWPQKVQRRWLLCNERGLQLLRRGSAEKLVRYSSNLQTLYRYYWDGMHLKQSFDLCELMVNACRESRPDLEAQWLHEQTVFYHCTGRFAQARGVCREGIKLIFRLPHLSELRGHFFHRMARIEQDCGDLRRARRFLRRALLAKSQIGSCDVRERETASAKLALSVIDVLEGDHRSLEELEALDVSSFDLPLQLDHQREQARALRIFGRYEDAIAKGSAGQKWAEETAHVRHHAELTVELALLHALSRNVLKAFQCATTAVAVLGSKRGEEVGADTLCDLGHVFHLIGQPEPAARHYVRAMGVTAAGVTFRAMIGLALLHQDRPWAPRYGKGQALLMQGSAACRALLYGHTRQADVRAWLALPMFIDRRCTTARILTGAMIAVPRGVADLICGLAEKSPSAAFTQNGGVRRLTALLQSSVHGSENRRSRF